MSTVVIPTRTDLASYEMQIELGGDLFTLALHWNTRAATWFLDVADEDGAAIATGVAVVIGWPLLRLVQTTGAPAGHLLAVDTTGRDDPPGLEDLGDRVLLVFQEAAA